MSEELFINYLGLASTSVKSIIGLKSLNLNEKFFIFSGKGPRDNSFHLGNYLTYLIISRVSQKIKCPVIFQISNDEKRFETNKNLSESRELALCVKDKLEYLSWGSRLKIFENLDPLNFTPLKMYSDIISYYLKVGQIEKVFGNINFHNANYVMMQMAPLLHFEKIYADYRPIVITEADQVGYFLLFRDLCNKLKVKSPIIVLLNPLKDILLKEKMSSNNSTHAVDFSLENLVKINRSISDISGKKDFGLHLIDFFYFYVDKSIQDKLTMIREEYFKTKSSEKFKKLLIKCFGELFVKSNSLDLYTLCDKDIDMFYQLIELEKHVKSRNPTITN